MACRRFLSGIVLQTRPLSKRTYGLHALVDGPFRDRNPALWPDFRIAVLGLTPFPPPGERFVNVKSPAIIGTEAKEITPRPIRPPRSAISCGGRSRNRRAQ